MGDLGAHQGKSDGTISPLRTPRVKGRNYPGPRCRECRVKRPPWLQGLKKSWQPGGVLACELLIASLCLQSSHLYSQFSHFPFFFRISPSSFLPLSQAGKFQTVKKQTNKKSNAKFKIQAKSMTSIRNKSREPEPQ